MAEVSSPVFQLSIESFQRDVIERSQQVPVFLLFWTDQMPPSVSQKHILEALATEYQGKFALGLIDVAADPQLAQQLAQQLQVQGIPAIKVIRDGQMADQLDGPQGEQVLRQLVDQHTMTGGELVKAELFALIAAGRYDQGRSLLEQALAEEPGNATLLVELADLLARDDQLDEARTVLARAPEDAEERKRPETRIELMAEIASLPALEALESTVAATPTDLGASAQLALRLGAEGGLAALERAMELALDVMMKDRKFDDEVGRRTLLRLFELVPRTDETGGALVKAVRRRMFNFLH